MYITPAPVLYIIQVSYSDFLDYCVQHARNTLAG